MRALAAGRPRRARWSLGPVIAGKIRDLTESSGVFRSDSPMRRLQNLQLIGPVTLFCAVAAAEGAVYGLARAPSSEMWWYINIQLFGAFQRSHYLLNGYLDLQYLQL